MEIQYNKLNHNNYDKDLDKNAIVQTRFSIHYIYIVFYMWAVYTLIVFDVQRMNQDYSSAIRSNSPNKRLCHILSTRSCCCLKKWW